MSEQEKSVVNIALLVDQLIESEKYERALNAARHGQVFCEKCPDSQVASMAKILFKSVDSLLTPFYPLDERDMYDARHSEYA